MDESNVMGHFNAKIAMRVCNTTRPGGSGSSETTYLESTTDWLRIARGQFGRFAINLYRGYRTTCRRGLRDQNRNIRQINGDRRHTVNSCSAFWHVRHSYNEVQLQNV